MNLLEPSLLMLLFVISRFYLKIISFLKIIPKEPS